VAVRSTSTRQPGTSRAAGADRLAAAASEEFAPHLVESVEFQQLLVEDLRLHDVIQ
jgi:hypothetical protein